MRKYLNENETKLAAVVCNGCGKNLPVENGILKEECISVRHSFGYFSKRDGQIQMFDLCEDCYEKLAAGLQIPAQVQEQKELL